MKIVSSGYLTRMLHEGNEVQGECGKQGLSIARRCIAVAMDQGGSAKIAYMEVGDRATQELFAESSQIYPDKFFWKEFEQLCWPKGRRAGCP